MSDLSPATIAREALAILEGHVGQRNAIPREDLRMKIWAGLPVRFEAAGSAQISIRYFQLSDREMRRAIAEEAPWVCSCSRGYYLPATAEEREAAILYHVKKIRGEQERIKAIRRHYLNLDKYKQLEFEERP